MMREKLTAKPWAYATRQGFKPGEPTGNYFRYFETEEDAERSAKITARNKRWHGPIEYRPGECNAVTLEGAAWIANDNKPDLPWWLEGAE